jgi:hypothetical protein
LQRDVDSLDCQISLTQQYWHMKYLFLLFAASLVECRALEIEGRYLPPESIPESGLDLNEVSKFIQTGKFINIDKKTEHDYRLLVELKRVDVSKIKKSGKRIYATSSGRVSVIDRLQMQVGSNTWELPKDCLLGVCNPKIPDLLKIARTEDGMVVLTMGGPDGAESYDCQIQFRDPNQNPLVVIRPWVGPKGHRNEEILLK